jgi:hypothetical protein
MLMFGCDHLTQRLFMLCRYVEGHVNSLSRVSTCFNPWLRLAISAFCLVSLPEAVCAFGNPTFANAITNGIVNIPGLTEASGIVASLQNAEVLWTHNDSGHPPQVFALDTQGRLLGTYGIPGNTDNEDIGMGPGPVPNVRYLYVADIGDNNTNRANIKIYQIPEPAVYARQYTNPALFSLKGARTITLHYPDGPRDAEAMFVDPITGDLFIASKEDISQIYSASKSQLDTNDFFTLASVRTLNFAVPSGADISPSGNEIVVRRESVAALWLRSNGQSVSEALGGAAISIPVQGIANGEPNGEAIGFDALGSGYYTLSDSISNQPLRYFARTSNDGPGPPPSTLVSAGSSWRYLDDGSNQGTAWRNPAFNDASWNIGLAQFGYGDGDEKTVVSFGPNPNNKHVTTYFRKTFVEDNPGDVTNLTARLIVDDGATVYLNGAPVIYENLVPEAAYDTLATPMLVALQSTWHSYRLPTSLLAHGTNTLAVEIHQSSLSGSNISFDLQLLAAGRNAAYEPFDYAAGTALAQVTNASGQWWTVAGSNASVATTVAGSLDVKGLFPSAGGSMQFGAVDGPSARFNLLSNVNSGTLFFSLALKVTGLGALSTAGGWLAAFNNSRGTQGTTPTELGTRILAREAGAGGFNLGVAKNTTTPSEWVWSPQVFAVGETIFVVGSYTFNAGNSTNDVAMLWLNPEPTAFGSEQTPVASLIATNGADITSNQIGSFVFMQRGLNNVNQPGEALVDELRIGTSWPSVTPPAPFVASLSITQTGTNLILSWSTNTAGFVLESAASLNPTSLWTQNPTPVSVVSSQYTVTNTISAGNAFYRLRKLP